MPHPKMFDFSGVILAAASLLCAVLVAAGLLFITVVLLGVLR